MCKNKIMVIYYFIRTFLYFLIIKTFQEFKQIFLG